MDEKRETELLSIRRESEEAFDKLVVYVSGGGLVLTVGFVEKIIKITEAASKTFLLLTWIFFAASLLTVLISHRTSVYSIDLEFWKKEKKSERVDKITHFLNNASFGCLLFAIISFIIFILENI